MANTLNGGRTYYVRARHKATNGLASEWSPPVRFTTSSAMVYAPGLRTPTLADNGSTTMDGYSVARPGGISGYTDGTTYPQSFEVTAFVASPGLVLKNLVVEWGTSISLGQTITTTSTIFSIETTMSQTYYFRFKYVSTSNVESPWSKIYSFKTSAPSINIDSNNVNFYLVPYDDVRASGGGYEADPESYGLVFAAPSFAWIWGTWVYRATTSGRIAFYDAPSGGNLIGSLNVPISTSSDYINTWKDSDTLKSYPSGLIVGRTYYLSLEATVINYLHESNMGGPPPSIAPLPTGYYSAPQRVSLTIRDFPTTVPSYILNSTGLPIKLQNNNLVVNGAIYHANYGFNSFIDFEVYNGTTLTASETISTSNVNLDASTEAWNRILIYKNSTTTNYTIKARWRFTAHSSYFYPSGLAVREWTTIKA